VLQYEGVPDPVDVPGRATVLGSARALDHVDRWQRRGIQRVKIPLPHIPGGDIAGEVATAGHAAAPAGTRVMVRPGPRVAVAAPAWRGAITSARPAT
jgi:NADPH:quinone reductase-like Zn-dependent oxidoreductase